MIETELQYQTTKAQLKRFEEAIEALKANPSAYDDRILKAMMDALISERDILSYFIKEYEQKL